MMLFINYIPRWEVVVYGFIGITTMAAAAMSLNGNFRESFTRSETMRLLMAMLLLACGATAAPALTMGQLMARCASLQVTDIEVSLKSNKLLDALDAGKCWGQLEAFLDLATIELPDPNLPNASRPLGACPRPDTLNFPKMVQMFLAFARAHPNDLQKSAAQMVSLMLIEKFPCRR